MVVEGGLEKNPFKCRKTVYEWTKHGWLLVAMAVRIWLGILLVAFPAQHLDLAKKELYFVFESSIDPSNVFPQNIGLPAKNFQDQSRLDAKTKICLIFGANLFSLRSEIVDSLRRMSGLTGWAAFHAKQEWWAQGLRCWTKFCVGVVA